MVVEEVYVSRDLRAIKFKEIPREEVGRGPTLRERDWIFVGYRAETEGGEAWLSKLGTPLSGKPASVEAVERRTGSSSKKAGGKGKDRKEGLDLFLWTDCSR